MNVTTLNEIADYMRAYNYDQVSIGLHSHDGTFIILRSSRVNIPKPAFGKGDTPEEAWVDLMSKESPPPKPEETDSEDDLDLDLDLDDDDLDLDLT